MKCFWPGNFYVRRATGPQPGAAIRQGETLVKKRSEKQDDVVSGGRLEAILDSAVDAIVCIDGASLIETVNPAAERLFQYDRTEMIDQNVKMLMPEPFRAEHDGYVRHHRETGIRKIIGIGREVVGQRKDGSTFPMHLSVGEFFLDGESHYTGIIHDLTVRQRFDAMATRLGRIVEASVNEIYIFEANSLQFIAVNSGARANLGYSLDELEQMTPIDVKPEFSKADFERLIEPLKTGEKERLEFATVHRRKDGTDYDVQINLSLHGAEDPPVFVAVVLDTTERLQTERALQQSQRMEAIGQLTGGIAHDFNNLLTVVIGNLELLQMRDLDQTQNELVSEAQEAADLGARLTARLLAFARRSHLEPQTVDLNAQVLGLTDLLHRTLGEQINLSNALSTGLWSVRADPTQIESAIVNLAVNARDAMARGGKLVIETRNSVFDDDAATREIGVKPGDYVQLSVSDTGTGMSRQVQERVFEPFFTTKEAGRGTGLGLSMVYGFAKQSGGHVTVYSEIDQGTTINLYLPRVDDHVQSPKAVETGSLLPRGDGQVILVVEDDERVRRLTVRRIGDLGYTVIEAANGAEALDIVSKNSRIDLVFTDIIMPGGMSGYELCDALRADAPDIKIVLTSGFAEDLVHADELGEQGLMLVRKPYRQTELARAIKQTLDQS
ncbi:MAG: PAS domain S-box protein [Rhizobiales bacterium]|nr:PAS domain S-box protein [Hyphomicrobiales bacterium]